MGASGRKDEVIVVFDSSIKGFGYEMFEVSSCEVVDLDNGLMCPFSWWWGWFRGMEFERPMLVDVLYMQDRF